MKSNMFRLFVLGVATIGVFSTGCQKRSRVGPTTRASEPRRPAAAPKAQFSQQPPAQRPPRPSGDPKWFPPGGISGRWTTIVVHHSATATGNARSFDRSHRDKGWDELGYHFVIGNGTTSGDGVVEVGSRWRAQKHGAHCKTPDNYYNDHGIGICLVGDFTKTRPTPRQMASLSRLVSFLCDQCRIPDSRVTTHGLVTNKTQCPGRNFPIMSLRRSLAMNLPQGNYPQ